MTRTSRIIYPRNYDAFYGSVVVWPGPLVKLTLSRHVHHHPCGLLEPSSNGERRSEEMLNHLYGGDMAH